MTECSGCGHCAEICPAWAIMIDKTVGEIAKIDQRRCYQCRRCESNCPQNAIFFGRPLKEKEYIHEKFPEQVLIPN